jgi:hypothetical protein
MTPAPHHVTLDRDDALYLRDVLTLTGRYLRNPYRRSDLAAGISEHAATAADLLTNQLTPEDEN